MSSLSQHNVRECPDNSCRVLVFIKKQKSDPEHERCPECNTMGIVVTRFSMTIDVTNG